ncbi:DNA-binding NarL/FixJ family response regulator [Actinoalloteichus hoggarensis]|uniref:Response regulator protein VraR n=1 Tax=Actinoalloteichus hoggarensis TaxID=1470176 RepID=A0A221VYN6_9PSEU|nr:response regulator transcription factor [Actinoalloteichus hoggarensis]ASO18640.1 Response regulator protein VraR [Actinoalloteichus hoggarensis]MBB5922009.1 DNA-binding NarL/FixJ family response regulator [Actinoalloteichus hoggarensis]
MNESIRLLICEDQELVRTGYVTVFSTQADMTVVGEAANGREAVELARRTRPDVVVMDVRMPVLDGIEATRRIAGPGVEDPPKVLVVTTFNVDAYVYDALRAGASGFLLKDTPPRRLIDGIRTIARGESLLAPEVTRNLIGRFADRLRPADASHPERDHVVRTLTRRELEVLEQLADGLSNAEIAETLTIATETVKTYVSRILTKLDLRDRVQAVVLAYRIGLVPGDGNPPAGHPAGSRTT